MTFIYRTQTAGPRLISFRQRADLTGIIRVGRRTIIVTALIALIFLVFIIRHKSCRAGVIPSSANHVSDQLLRT